MIEVALRLSDGDCIQTGVFRQEAEAREHAEELIRTLGTLTTWPRVGDRYIRPGAVVSVDLSQTRDLKWSGSETRIVWGGEADKPQP